MFKAFYNNETMKLVVRYHDKYFDLNIFEEQGDTEPKEEFNFNLIAIEFDKKTPFNTEERKKKFNGEEHTGYIVEVSSIDNTITQIHLLMTNLGWGETDTLKKDIDIQEVTFVESILREVGAIARI